MTRPTTHWSPTGDLHAGAVDGCGRCEGEGGKAPESDSLPPRSDSRPQQVVRDPREDYYGPTMADAARRRADEHRRQREAPANEIKQTDPGHFITVTGGGPFGRAWFDCSCGLTAVRASKRAANLVAIAHYREVYQEGAQ